MISPSYTGGGLLSIDFQLSKIFSISFMNSSSSFFLDFKSFQILRQLFGTTDTQYHTADVIIFQVPCYGQLAHARAKCIGYRLKFSQPGKRFFTQYTLLFEMFPKMEEAGQSRIFRHTVVVLVRQYTTSQRIESGKTIPYFLQIGSYSFPTFSLINMLYDGCSTMGGMQPNSLQTLCASSSRALHIEVPQYRAKLLLNI